MAISENRVDISSITDTIKSLTTGLTSSKPAQQIARLANMDLVPQSLTNKSLGIFSDIMCKDFNYSLDLASLFGSLDRSINFGSLSLCGNSVSANPFDGSLINGVNSIRSNLLNQYKNIAGIPNSLLGNLNSGLNGVLGKYNIPSDCINGFDLSNPYNVNLSGMDRDILGAGGNLCRNRANTLSTAYNMSVLSSTPNALYLYTNGLSNAELLGAVPNIFTSYKDDNINTKINAVTDKFLVNGSIENTYDVNGNKIVGDTVYDINSNVIATGYTGNRYDQNGSIIPNNNLMVSSVLKDDIYDTPDDVLSVHVDSSNIVSNLDYTYTNSGLTGSSDKNNVIIPSKNKAITNNVSDNVLKLSKDANSINTSNDTQNVNKGYNDNYNAFKGYSNDSSVLINNITKEKVTGVSSTNELSTSDKELLNMLNPLEASEESTIIDLKDCASYNDRFYRLRHILNITDKTWDKDDDGNVSYHKLKKSISLGNITTSMVKTQQPKPMLSLDVSDKEYTDFEQIYILNNIA